MQPILYIQIGNVLWAVLSDGSWIQMLPNEQLVPEVEVVVLNTDILDIAFNEDTTSEDESSSNDLLIASQNGIESTFNQSVRDFSESSGGLSFVAYIRAVLPEQLVSNGYVTRPAVQEIENPTSETQAPERLNPDAILTVDILDGGDGYENQFEVPSVTIQGDALKISDEWLVTITITDSLNNSITVTTTVENESYTLSGVDLSSLAEGPLTVTSVVSDIYGNNLNAVDTTIKDTLATVNVNFDGGGDEYLNQYEIATTRLEGTIENIEDGQRIQVTVTDSLGAVINLETVVTGGSWSLDDVDLSGLSEGTLTVVAESIDIAGNPATSENTIVKDTLASVTVDVDDGGDGYLNIEERQSVTLSGQVSDVENGQTVSVTVQDSLGAMLSFNAVVVDGMWQVEGANLSTLADGALTVSASVNDVAGNQAKAMDEATTIDATAPTIDIDTDFYISGGLAIDDFREGIVTEMRGTTSGVEQGLAVTIRVSDGDSTLNFTGLVDASGSWTVTGIDVNTLNLNSTWTIEAEVLDVAGNHAVDTMPTIVLPGSTVFSENIVGFFGEQSSSAAINIENGVPALHAEQPSLSALTSVGQSINVVVAEDGLSLQGTSTDDRLVFSAEVNDDGTVQITFYEAIDHGVGQDELVTNVLVESTQSDADGTQETVVAPLEIAILDADPVIENESYSVTEGQVISGNVLENDIDIDGDLYIRYVRAGGEIQSVPDGGSVSFSLEKGELTVFSDGSWQLNASRNLDHTVEQSLVFDYLAADDSKDYGVATATIDIIDGQAGYVGSATIKTAEVPLGAALLTTEGSVNVIAGSDNPDPTSLYFGEASITKLEALGLTSSVSNTELSYTLSSSGKQITAFANGVTVFTLTLSGIESGNDVLASISLTLDHPIDQFNSSDTVTFPLTIGGTDLDSTPLVENEIDFVLKDGVDPTLSNLTVVAMEEINLESGTIFKTGSLQLDIGSDYVDSLRFSELNQPTLVSSESELLYRLSDDGTTITGYIIEGGVEVNIFQSTLLSTLPLESSSEIEYSFELYRSFDLSKDQILDIPLLVNATDSDGDTTSVTLDITLEAIEGLNDDASLTVNILDGGDGYENQFEVPSVTIQGDALKISDEWLVTITITDSLNNSITVTTTVENESYTLSGVDLSSLAEGPLTVTSVVSDIYGNNLNAVDTTIKDTLATVNVNFDGGGDEYLNQYEIATTRLEGTIENIEDGQRIQVTVTDSLGAVINLETVVTGGSWSLDDVDLSGLSEGTLTVVAESIDIAGNPATSENTIVKDTLASVTVDVDDGGDGYLNIEERQSVTLSGQVSDVENGQTVSVTVQDSLGAMLSFNAVVVDGMWQVEGANLSTLADGALTVSASVNDVAGNQAKAMDEATTIDATAPTIDIDTDFYISGGLAIDDFREGIVTEMRGTTSGVEQGLAVTIRVSDGDSTLNFTGLVDASGSWTVTGIDVNTLNLNSTWTIEAEVLDVAGNHAVDTMPTIVLPGSTVFSENIVGFFGEQSSSAAINIENGVPALHAEQPSLSALTSVGQSINVVVAEDGLSLQGTSTDDRLVFSAEVNDDGTVQITFYEAIDHGVGQDELVTNVLVESIQSDADGTQETVVAPLTITIYDSDPVIRDDTYSVVEDQTITGNLLENDIDLDGTLYVKFVEAGGEQKSILEGGSVSFSLEKGELTVFFDGSWQFDAGRNLDHSVEQSVSFSYLAADDSQDYGLANATIDITDGQAGYVGNATIDVTEVPLDGPILNFEGTVNIVAGSDNPDPSSLYFGGSSITKLEALGLTSSVSDNELSYTLSSSGKQITAFANGVTVFTLTLSGVESGNDVLASISLTLEHPIDQFNSSDTVTFPLTIGGVDLDATPLVENEIDYVLKDGADSTLNNLNGVEVKESDLANGSVLSSGNFQVEVGSDYLESLSFIVSEQPLLTSGEQVVLYQVSADGKTLDGYILDEDGQTQIPIFQAILNAPLPIDANGDITYSFELFQALDQQENTDPNVPLVVTAMDSDQDNTSVVLDINVIDNDNGQALINSGNVELTETPVDTNIAPDGVSAIANTDVIVTSSFDPIVYLGVDINDGDTVKTTLGDAVTYNGEAVTWYDNNDGSFDAISDTGDVVFRVTLPSDFSLPSNDTSTVNVTVELYHSLDHVLGDGTQLSISMPIVARDSDGSEISTESNILVYDGLFPELVITEGITVNESGLNDDSLDSGIEGSSPSITLLQGSDSIASVSVNIDMFNVLGYKTSSGSLVSLDSPDSNGWLYARDESEQDVFRIRFNTDGTVEFDLYRALEHDEPDGVPADENTLELSFSIYAVDKDGDQSEAETYTVSVVDDIPEDTSSPIEIELTEGDEFSGNWFSNNADLISSDGTLISSLTYAGETYDTASSVFSNDAWTIDLINSSDGNLKYGTLTIAQDGTFTLTTEIIVNTPVGGLLDDLTITVTDADGDQASSEAQLILDDARGFIRTVNVDTLEDNGANNSGDPTPVALPIRVSPGDTENNERVEAIRISVESLQGGALFLDGVRLEDDDNDGFISLSGTELMGGGIFTVPNGDLTYQPALNLSGNTIKVSLAVSALIVSDVEPDGFVLQGNNTLNVNVLPVADLPEWSNDSDFSYQSVEDSAESLSLNIVAEKFDQDGSETLHYQVSNIPDGLILTLNGSAIEEGKSYSQSELDQIEITSNENLAGRFTFDVTAVTTESGSVFADEQDKTAEITEQVVIDISPDADVPALTVKNIQGLEDQAIDLKEYILGRLTDTDGSESLSYRIEVQDGWTLPVGAGITLIGINTYLVTSNALANSEALLQPKSDISSFTESLSLQVTAISTESTIDDLAPLNETAESQSATIDIKLKGVVDEPIVLDGGQGNWQYDQATKVISNLSTLDEDNLIQLDFIIQTSDDDLSEEINILLQNIPVGTQLTDVNGDPIVLPIAYVDPITGPVYQVSNAVLENTYLKTEQDFSGTLSMDVIVVSTEPDGDSAETPLKVEMEISPIVDQTDGQELQSNGIEDNFITLNLEPVVNQDIDSSESLTGYTIVSIPDGLTLYFDGNAVEESNLPLELNELLDGSSATLSELLNSGRITVKANEDLSGTFSLEVQYEVTDTSPTLETDVKAINGSLSVVVSGKVDIGNEDIDKTRLEGATEVFTSTDGSAVDVSGGITFTEADIDGSEYLDYIVLQIPQGQDLIVTHPNGASQDADGNWLIPMEGITSDSVLETAQDLLAGASIYSPSNTEILDVNVLAYVRDGTDAQYITGQFQIQITGHEGDGDQCADPGEPGSVQSGDIVGKEGEDVSIGAFLNPDVASSDGNLVSFFVAADSLPEGVELTGEGVIPAYDNAGNLLGYSISSAGLSSLTLTGVDEDFAGCITFNLEVTETAPCDGDSKTTSQTITVQISPAVDDIAIAPSQVTVQEDTITNLNLALVLGDSEGPMQSITGEGDAATGLESVNWVSLSVSDENARFTAVDPSLLIDNGDGTWVVTDVTRLNEIQLIPPENYSGELVISVDANITDEVTGSCLSTDSAKDTQTKSTEVTVTVAPVVDKAVLETEDVVGDEDSYIYLGNLSASLIDQDGSESMSLVMTGVPDGAVLVWDNNGTFELLPNNGSTDGESKEWQLTQAQLDKVYFLPPLDFSGDIPLTLQAITQESGSNDYNYTTSQFNVGVKPIGDDVSLNTTSNTFTGDEGDSISIDFLASGFETNSNEYIEVSMLIKASSEPSALEGLGRIRIGTQFSSFTFDDAGNAVATVLVRANEVSGLEFVPKDAFGTMDVALNVRTFDQAIVSGKLETDFGDVQSTDLTIVVTPEADEPTLTADYQSIVSEASGSIPLGLSMNLVNPAPEEFGSVEIRGLPTDLELSHGERLNGIYTVDQEDVADLSIVGGFSGASDFTLSIKPIATLGAIVAEGAAQTVNVTLVEEGGQTLLATDANDLLIGGSGSDVFQFDSSGLGNELKPSYDVINDFQISVIGDDNDTIDIASIITATSITEVDNKLDLTENDDGVTLHIKPEETGTKQQILMQGVTLDQLYKGDSTGVAEENVLQKMIDDNNLLVGGMS
ncbi:RTX toxin [Vibrio sp. 1409]|uniref:Ig-like domain-containing protein n=1 Tax=Vibrio sp. 1409 TaxID=3074558 RepID=UPI001CF5F494|nr:RTX toxin [Vibrio alginolyticus]MDW2258180.1 RTX toxin [Vibrio sp. 1409]